MSKQLLNVMKEAVEILREFGLKGNPYHDSSSGRFTSGSGGGGSGGSGSGGGSSGGSRSGVASKPKKPSKIVAGGPPATGLAKPAKKHNVKLPKNKRRSTIDQASAAMKEMGYQLQMAGSKPVNGKWITSYKITDSKGRSAKIDADTLGKFIYANVGYKL